MTPLSPSQRSAAASPSATTRASHGRSNRSIRPGMSRSARSRARGCAGCMPPERTRSGAPSMAAAAGCPMRAQRSSHKPARKCPRSSSPTAEARSRLSRTEQAMSARPARSRSRSSRETRRFFTLPLRGALSASATTRTVLMARLSLTARKPTSRLTVWPAKAPSGSRTSATSTRPALRHGKRCRHPPSTAAQRRRAAASGLSHNQHHRASCCSSPI